MRRSAVSSHPPLPSLDSIRIADLPGLGHDAIHDLWRHLHRKPPPKGLAGELLVRALAYRIQIACHGGLSRGGEQRLAAAAREAARARIKTGQDAGEGGGSKAASSRTLRPGTRLLREWQGEVYEVVALADGFLWNGESHRSLSVIAKAITGTSWNGWLFFGVERKKKGARLMPSSMPSSMSVKTALNAAPMEASETRAASSSSGRARSREVRFVSFDQSSAAALSSAPAQGSRPPGGR